MLGNPSKRPEFAPFYGQIPLLLQLATVGLIALSWRLTFSRVAFHFPRKNKSSAPARISSTVTSANYMKLECLFRGSLASRAKRFSRESFWPRTPPLRLLFSRSCGSGICGLRSEPRRGKAPAWFAEQPSDCSDAVFHFGIKIFHGIRPARPAIDSVQ